MDKSSDDLITITSSVGDVVATANLTFSTDMKDIKELPGVTLELYYFSKIKLHPIVVFKHLAGVPLKTWLEGCCLTFPTCVVGPLAYLHGKSEVMRGKHYIGVVLLAKICSDKPVPQAAWMSAVPGIYKRFTHVLDTRKIENS